MRGRFVLNNDFSLLELIEGVPTINILDVGAMSLGAGTEPYAPLVRANKARIVGFEPDAAECEKLNHQFGDTHRFHPHFIGDGGPATFYETNAAMTGSLFRPNKDLVEKFQNLHEVMTLKAEHAVETRRLDDIPEIGDVDFLKIDVQGSELAVFEGGETLLANVTLIQTEVEFLALYEGQPLFAEVDQFLRARGFQFHTFLGFGSRCFKPVIVNDDVNVGIRQYLWADAVYVRDFLGFGALAGDKLLKLAVLVHDIFKSVDLCLYILNELDGRQGGALAQAYMRKLAGG